MEDLLTELCASTRVVGVSEELRASLANDAEALPITSPPRPAERRGAVPAEADLRPGPAATTRDRLVDGTPHRPGRDYLGLDELLDDLSLIRDSMIAGGDRLTADGAILRLIRTATAMGLRLAELDIREHSGKHHPALGAVYDALGELDQPYAELDRPERTALLCRRDGARGVR